MQLITAEQKKNTATSVYYLKRNSTSLILSFIPELFNENHFWKVLRSLGPFQKQTQATLQSPS